MRNVGLAPGEFDGFATFLKLPNAFQESILNIVVDSFFHLWAFFISYLAATAAAVVGWLSCINDTLNTKFALTNVVFPLDDDLGAVGPLFSMFFGRFNQHQHLFLQEQIVKILRIRIRRIRMFLGLLDPHPDQLVGGTVPAQDPTIVKQN